MKTIVKTTLALLLLANLNTSCKKGSESTVPEHSSESVEATNDTIKNDTVSTSTATSSSTESVGNASQSANSTKQSTAVTSSKTKATKDNKKSGMSAPDGTDAENHDGDMYTKNDNKPMPSGTPIK